LRLFEHPDFEQAILRAAEHFRERNLRPAIIEKDYYVTEALRVLAKTSGDKIIFKGGTSLAKGWNLIQRFSEDIDIFLDPTAFQPILGKNAIDRELKKLRDAVGQHPALLFVENESQTIGGFGRNDRFSYTQRFGGPGEVANRVLLEAGTASGREPSAIVELRSYLGQYLEERKQSLGAEDEGTSPFACSIFGGPLLRRCSLSTARSSCSSETNSLWAAMHGTTTTCFNCQSTAKSASCSAQANTVRSRLITIRSVESISLGATSFQKT
jgi:hypothetical protein